MTPDQAQIYHARQIGVFADGPSGTERDEKVLLLEPRVVTEDTTRVTVTVDDKPGSVGIDPYNKLIDKVASDNRKSVTLQ